MLEPGQVREILSEPRLHTARKERRHIVGKSVPKKSKNDENNERNIKALETAIKGAKQLAAKFAPMALYGQRPPPLRLP